MKSILIGILMGVQCLSAQIHLVKFSESVYICEDMYYSRENSVVFIGPEYVTIIGATWSPASARALHDSIARVTNLPVLEIINTNYHPDRAGGNPYWQNIGCEIHATERTNQLMKLYWDSICDFTRKSIPDLPEIPLVLPTKVHEGDYKLQNGKIEVLYLGPSHTEDGVFVYLPGEKLLYGGCILKPYLGNLEQANLQEYPKTLRKLKQASLEINTIIAGHGTPIHGASLIDDYLRMLEEYIDRCILYKWTCYQYYVFNE
jgi:metallo-beta-lactamase class B